MGLDDRCGVQQPGAAFSRNSGVIVSTAIRGPLIFRHVASRVTPLVNGIAVVCHPCIRGLVVQALGWSRSVLGS